MLRYLCFSHVVYLIGVLYYVAALTKMLERHNTIHSEGHLVNINHQNLCKDTYPCFSAKDRQELRQMHIPLPTTL